MSGIVIEEKRNQGLLFVPSGFASALTLLSLLSVLFLFLFMPSSYGQNNAIEYRFALVVSFSDYNRSFDENDSQLSSLSLTTSDGDKMEAALIKAGFEVLRISDGSIDGFDDQKSRQIYLSFIQKIRSHEPNVIAFFYYSGHGASTLNGDEVFLLPPIGSYRSNADIERYGWPVSDLIEGLQAGRASFVVVDACRNIPFSSGRNLGKGLGIVRSKNGVLVAYATEPGGIAPDDGVYATELSNAISDPGSSSFTAFEIARLRTAQRRISVSESRGGNSGDIALPWVESSLLNHVVFVPADGSSRSERVDVLRSPKVDEILLEQVDDTPRRSPLEKCSGENNSRQQKLCYGEAFWAAIDEQRFADAYYMLTEESAAIHSSITSFRQNLFSHLSDRGPITRRNCFVSEDVLDFRSRPVAQVNCLVSSSSGEFAEDLILERNSADGKWMVSNFVAERARGFE